MNTLDKLIGSIVQEAKTLNSHHISALPKQPYVVGVNSSSGCARFASHVLMPFLLATLVLSANQATAEIPRTATGKPDFSGVWQTLSNADYGLEAHAARKDAPPGPGIVEGELIPYKPAALAKREENFAARATA